VFSISALQRAENLSKHFFARQIFSFSISCNVLSMLWLSDLLKWDKMMKMNAGKKRTGMVKEKLHRYFFLLSSCNFSDRKFLMDTKRMSVKVEKVI
jgi:hypothetical protein